MISLTDIAKSIEQPEHLVITDVDSIQEYATKYPYSQVFSILYLKGLSKNSDVRFEEELQKHSYRISDRARLFQLISENEEVEMDGISTPLDDRVEEVGVEEGAEDREVEEVKEKIEDQVDKSILEHAISANYQLPELNEEEKIALEEKNISKEIEVEKLPEIEPVEIAIDTKQSFNSWLSSNSNYEEKENQPNSLIDHTKSDSEDSKTKNALFGEVKKEKVAFFSPTQKAKESLQEDALPVSETLAKIYALQGNFPKAISAYRQLSLNYPEKKIFFAIRIKELEKKLNTK